MDKNIHLDLIVENDREWRQYLVQRIDEVNEKVAQIEKELSTFKIRVFMFASMFGGATGLSAEYLKHLF